MVQRASILFLALVLINIGAGFIDFSALPTFIRLSMAQLLIIVPVILYLIITKQNFFQAIRLRKVNIWSLLLVIPLVYVLEPLLICINAISMSFSTNVIATTMEDIVNSMPYIAGLSMMALIPALVEEITFRGVLLNSFHRDSNPWPGIIFSAICFGAMHMNFNQIAYALVLGIIMGIVLEASGSILTTMLVHFLYNGTSTTLLYLLPVIMKWSDSVLEDSGMSQAEIENMMSVSEAVETTSGEQMLMMGLIMIIPALIGLILAAGLVYLIARLNNRQLILLGMFRKKTKEQKEAMAADRVKIMNVFLWIALGFCMAYAVLTEVLIRMA